MLRGGRGRLVPAGRWALLRDTVEEAGHDVERFARQWLRRYGVVMRELLAREPRMPPWRDLVRVLRTLEARGEVRGGRFVAGMVGEQFALPEAVEALRAVRRRTGAEEIVLVSAGDPLNLSGILVPGPRIAPASRDVIAFKDGAVVETGELGGGTEPARTADGAGVAWVLRGAVAFHRTLCGSRATRKGELVAGVHAERRWRSTTRS
jgi:ATP-dependent Lhr-like helicase